MKIVSILDLRKNIYKATEELPVEVQAKGKTLFFILKDLPENKPEEMGTMPIENPPPISTTPEEIDIADVSEIVSMWCQLHFEAKKNYPCQKISYEDENGTEIVHEKWACPKCIQSYQRKGVGRVYFL